mgnify:CR=1 FL=1
MHLHIYILHYAYNKWNIVDFGLFSFIDCPISLFSSRTVHLKWGGSLRSRGLSALLRHHGAEWVDIWLMLYYDEDVKELDELVLARYHLV